MAITYYSTGVLGYPNPNPNPNPNPTPKPNPNPNLNPNPNPTPYRSDEAACFVHAAGGCHLPRKHLRAHPLLETICSLRRANLSSNGLAAARQTQRIGVRRS